MIKSRLLSAAVLAAGLGTLLVPAASAAAAKDIRAQPFRFTAVNLPHSNFAEPNVQVNSHYHVYFCGPGGGDEIVSSSDWKKFNRFTVKNTGLSGGDCDLKIAPDNSVYISDLGIVDSVIRRAVDGGDTPASYNYQMWTEPIEQDRQWIAIDPKDGSNVYYSYHDFVAEAEIGLKSTDGGRTFPIHTLISNNPQLAADTMTNTNSGPIRVNPANSQDVAVVYSISTQAANSGHCGVNGLGTGCFGETKQIVVGVSTNGGLTYTDSLAMKVPGANQNLGQGLFPWLTWDNAGNLYAIASMGGKDDAGRPTNGIMYAVSTDLGATWGTPVNVETGRGAVVFPSAVGGAAGVIDLTWIQSTATDQADASGVWSTRFVQVRAANTARPSRSAVVSGPVVRHGAVCTAGINCSGNRNLLDFAELTLDPFGYAHMAVASTEPAPGEGAEHVVWWRQDAGPSALFAPCERSCVYTRPGPGNQF